MNQRFLYYPDVAKERGGQKYFFRAKGGMNAFFRPAGVFGHEWHELFTNSGLVKGKFALII